MRDDLSAKYGGRPTLLEDFLPPSAPASVPAVAIPVQAVAVDLAAELLAMQVPAELLSAIIRAYTAALLKQPEAATAEGRGRILQTLRDLVMDAILDGVNQVRGPHQAG